MRIEEERGGGKGRRMGEGRRLEWGVRMGECRAGVRGRMQGVYTASMNNNNHRHILHFEQEVLY